MTHKKDPKKKPDDQPLKKQYFTPKPPTPPAPVYNSPMKSPPPNPPPLGAALTIVATPIGNLGDITSRARTALGAAHLIAAEDTRTAKRLLTAMALPRPHRLLSARAHNEMQAAAAILRALDQNHAVAYLTDAGTPAISDPGARLVRQTRAAGYRVIPLPGPCAFTTLLSAAGLPDGPRHFYGFPPAAPPRRRQFFTTLQTRDGYSLFYEAPHRIAATLADLTSAFGGDQHIVIGRELTKFHEQILDATLAQATAAVTAGTLPARGEFTLAVQNPAHSPQSADGWRLFTHLSPHLPPRRAAALAAAITGADARTLYARHTAAKSPPPNESV